MPPTRSTSSASRTRRKVVSAHRTPKRLYDYAHSAKERGLKVVIAGAGGAAHLPGMTASMTSLPVLGVPIESQALKGMDSLLSIVQMPAGVPVGTLAIGKAGRDQRRAARRGDARDAATKRSAARLEAWREAADRIGRRSARMTIPPGSHHRHHRRRPARPDAGDGRRPARLPLPHLRPARAAAARPTSPPTSRRAAFDDVDALRALRRAASTSPPTSSRICRSRRSTCSATSSGPARARSPSPRTARREKAVHRGLRRAGRPVAAGRRPRRRSTRRSPSSALPARAQDPPLRL